MKYLPDASTWDGHSPTSSGATSPTRCVWHALFSIGLCCAVYVSVVVGTILTIINQGDVLLAGAITPLVVAKILLTYAVPYSVSTFSALLANRVKETVKEPRGP